MRNSLCWFYPLHSATGVCANIQERIQPSQSEVVWEVPLSFPRVLKAEVVWEMPLPFPHVLKA